MGLTASANVRVKDGQEVVLHPLPLDAYAERLRAQIDPWWKIFGKRPLIGRLEGKRLRVRRRISYGNSFQTYLRADLERHPGGTKVTCRFGVHPAAFGFLALWLFFVAAFFVSSLSQIVGIGAAGDRWPFLLVPLFMLGVGAATYPMGRFLARNEKAEILKILQEP